MTETKCKIRFIYVGLNCKRKNGVIKCLEICAIKGGGGGVGLLMANAVLNSQFDIFCTLPLVEGYKVGLFASLFFVLGLFCILTIIVILYL